MSDNTGGIEHYSRDGSIPTEYSDESQASKISKSSSLSRLLSFFRRSNSSLEADDSEPNLAMQRVKLKKGSSKKSWLGSFFSKSSSKVHIEEIENNNDTRKVSKSASFSSSWTSKLFSLFTSSSDSQSSKKNLKSRKVKPPKKGNSSSSSKVIPVNSNTIKPSSMSKMNNQTQLMPTKRQKKKNKSNRFSSQPKQSPQFNPSKNNSIQEFTAIFDKLASEVNNVKGTSEEKIKWQRKAEKKVYSKYTPGADIQEIKRFIEKSRKVYKHPMLQQILTSFDNHIRSKVPLRGRKQSLLEQSSNMNYVSRRKRTPGSNE